MKKVLFSLCVCLLSVQPCFADGFIIVDHPIVIPVPPRPPHPPRPPRPPVVRPQPIQQLAVDYHHVNVTIKDQIATTEVDQSFFNPNNQRLEGTYIFPLPDGAQIDKFSMDINGKMMEAELLDAGKARKIYEDIVRKMKDPALLEYMGRGMFKVRIFPIEPKSHKKVRIKYTQLLKSDTGLVEYRYPLNTEKFSSRPIKSVSVKVDVQTSRPIKSIYSPSHDVEIKRKGKKPRNAVVGFEANNVRPDTDFLLFYTLAKEKNNPIGLNLMAHRSGGEDGYFLLLASPGVDIDDDQIVSKDVVFVLDTSGSMAGEKIVQAKRALRFCVSNLNDEDRFQIVRFSTEAEPYFDGLVDASEGNRAKAYKFIDKLKAIGGTAIEDALVDAVTPVTDRTGKNKHRPYLVIFLTDGRPTIGNTSEEAIIKNVTKKIGDASVRVFCFGIGTNINTHLLDKIASQTRAFGQYVLPDEDIEIKVSNFYTKISHPVLADPTLKFGNGIRVTKTYPTDLPDIFKGDQMVLVGRYDGQGDSAIRLKGTVNGNKEELVYETKFLKSSGKHDFIPRLWATRRVGYLLDQIRLNGEDKELKSEVVELAREYGIVTPYTSYLIVEDEAQRSVPIAQRSLRAIEESRVASNALRRRFQSLQSAKSGDDAVAAAREVMDLKQSEKASAEGLAAPALADLDFGSSVPNADRPEATAPSVGRGGLPAGSVPLRLGQAGSAANRKGDTTSFAGQAVGGKSRQLAIKRIKGRTFYLNGSTWIDSKVQAAKKADRVRIKFGSTEYFDLLAKYPTASAWLSLGSQVQVLIDGVVYEIH